MIFTEAKQCFCNDLRRVVEPVVVPFYSTNPDSRLVNFASLTELRHSFFLCISWTAAQDTHVQDSNNGEA